MRCADPRPAHPCVAPLPYWPPPDVQRRPVAAPCPLQWAACPCWQPLWGRCTPPSAGCSSTPTPPPSHDPCVDRRTWVGAGKLPLHPATLLPRPWFPLPCCSDAFPFPRMSQLSTRYCFPSISTVCMFVWHSCRLPLHWSLLWFVVLSLTPGTTAGSAAPGRSLCTCSGGNEAGGQRSARHLLRSNNGINVRLRLSQAREAWCIVILLVTMLMSVTAPVQLTCVGVLALALLCLRTAFPF